MYTITFLSLLKMFSYIMGYNIDLSINLIKQSNYTKLEAEMIDIAQYYNCESFYHITETDETSKIPRCHSITNITFPDEEFNNFLKFIENIRKKREWYIECIYQGENAVKLIYASSYYLKTINKDKAEQYNTYKRERSYSEDEKMLIDKCQCK